LGEKAVPLSVEKHLVWEMGIFLKSVELNLKANGDALLE
jgi:hypothetical protein